MRTSPVSLVLILSAHAALAQSIPLPGGGVTVNADGSFSGTTREVGVFPGFPDEVDEARITGRIDPLTGTISGSYSGSTTFNENTGEDVVSRTEPVSGSISGRITPEGRYTVSWSGSASGSHSGRLPGYTVQVPVSVTAPAIDRGRGHDQRLGRFSFRPGGKPGHSDDPAFCGS